MTRKLEFHVEVQELNESGEYAPVEVQPRSTVGTGGIFQLRQGQQRRIKVALKPVANSGMLPLICESIVSMAFQKVMYLLPIWIQDTVYVSKYFFRKYLYLDTFFRKVS